MTTNQSFTIISSFEEILLPSSGKPLIICDIDYTFICPIYSPHYFVDKFKMKYFDEKSIERISNEYSNRSFKLGHIRQTDPKGFKKMVEQVQQIGGNLIFLTARHVHGHKKTLDDLNKVGLNTHKFKIHYTNNQISKGEYIKMYKLTEGYDYVCFIDDYLDYIHSVVDLFPDINCYRFSYI